MAHSQHSVLVRIVGTLAVAFGVCVGMLHAQEPAATRPPTRIDAQSRQLLDRTIQALGGQAFLNAKSLTSKGRAFFFRDGNTAGMQPFVSQVVYPDKRRFTFGKNKKILSMDTGNISYEGETKAVTLINNGTKGWELDQYGLVAQPEKQVKGWVLSNKYSLENLLRLRINDPGILIQMGKTDFVDNVRTQSIDIVELGGISIRLDVSPTTYLPTRIYYKVWNVRDKASDDYSDAYSDYKSVDGIQVPMHITRYLNGDRIGETFRNFAKLNEDYPEKLFNPE